VVSNLDANLALKLQTLNGTTLERLPQTNYALETEGIFRSSSNGNAVSCEVCELFYDSGVIINSAAPGRAGPLRGRFWRRLQSGGDNYSGGTTGAGAELHRMSWAINTQSMASVDMWVGTHATVQPTPGS